MTVALRRSPYHGDRVRKTIFMRTALWTILESLAGRRGQTASSLAVELIASSLRRSDLA